METPIISKTAYSSSASSSADWFADVVNYTKQEDVGQVARGGAARRLVSPPIHGSLLSAAAQHLPAPAIQRKPTMRIVKVFIADPNENIPLDKRVIYSGPEKLTDLDDNELFFEISIKELLDAHNETRVGTVDKKKSSATNIVYLEAARIRDLKMVVVDIAAF